MKVKCFLTFLILLLVINANAQDKNNPITPQNIIITPENTLPLKDSTLRDQVAKWCIEQLQSDDYKKIKAHPSSDIFEDCHPFRSYSKHKNLIPKATLESLRPFDFGQCVTSKLKCFLE